MADSSMDMTAIQIVSDQLARIDVAMEEITSLTKVRIDTEEQIVNPYAVFAAGDQPNFQERIDQAHELHPVHEEHPAQENDEPLSTPVSSTSRPTPGA
eukprot:9329817-Pyramimonas_sp.AAC.1